MNYILPITSKGQFTLPVKIRKSLNIRVNSTICVSFDEKSKLIRLTPDKDIERKLAAFRSMSGSGYKKNRVLPKGYSIDNIRDWVEKNYERL